MTKQENAFVQFVRDQKATVYSVCLMFADGKAEADDLFQEALINLWSGFASFRGDSLPRTWAYRVTLNTCISADRKKRRRPACQAIDIDPDILTDQTDVGQQTRLLHDRIQRLEPFDRAIVLLWLENLPYDEIGAIVGISAKAVSVRLVRIREKLKNQKD
mgnify:FL=1|jgi:RNA polymerase sigma factor, sigma-70 family